MRRHPTPSNPIKERLSPVIVLSVPESGSGTWRIWRQQAGVQSGISGAKVSFGRRWAGSLIE